MWGIIPAAGRGNRIQPLAFSKELLPVGSRLDGTVERPRAVSEHLIERMLFARRGKQDNAERNSNDAQANEKSHSALPQLSVSSRARKDESAVAQASCLQGILGSRLKAAFV